MSALGDWDSFYVIVGSSAGALIGLQFVVMTLVADRPPPRAAEAGPAFATPTIVHFSLVLLLSALVRVPWPAAAPAAIVWMVLGLGGALYMLVTMRRMGTQTAYVPVLEDWLFHGVLPLAAYALLMVFALTSFFYLQAALFGIGAAALLLLFVGIHNAWDATAYHVYVNLLGKGGKQD